VKNASMAVKEAQGKVLFLRKLLWGASSRSYGVEVARLAGLPPEVLVRAREILGNLESGELDEAGRPRLTHRLSRMTEQLPLFAGESSSIPELKGRILDELAALSLDATTPLEALNLIARWKESL